MNSSIINILEILNAARTISSVGFSDGYNFDEEKAEEFFENLVDNGTFHAPIFSGIMILEEADDKGGFVVVDGLQRLTTLGLLLSALCEGYKDTSKKNEEARYKIFTRYLVNENDVKLRITQDERSLYRKIVFSDRLTDEERQSNLYKTYKLFLTKIIDREISATDLFKLVSRMQFMVVFIDKSKISARELYQSLNGNKSDMSQVNLIAALILHKGKEASRMWKKLVESYKKIELTSLLKNFIRDFLTVQGHGKIPNENQLYQSFKAYYAKISKYKHIEDIVENMQKYSQFYLKIVQADFDDFEIQKQIIKINESNGQDSYPYLMEVLDDLENARIDKEIFLDILTMINSFIDSRAEDPSSATLDFATLSGELNKRLALKDYTPQEVGEGKLTINEMNQLSTFEV